MSLSDEEKASFTKIIDSILEISDLETISAKKVRKAIQAAVDRDLTPQKDLVNKLIEERYAFYESKSKPAPTAPSTATATPAESVSVAPKREHVDTTSTPPKKRVKRESSAVKQESSADDDAAFAARLQAEEDTASRPTRGSATRKRQVKATSTPSKRKKSAAKVKADDDSDLETGGEREEVKKTGAFHKPLALSEPLAELVGEQQMSRPQVVKKIWEYVKERNLQNPDDKRQIMCDEKLQAVFKQDSVHMFTMNKILSKNLYPIDE